MLYIGLDTNIYNSFHSYQQPKNPYFSRRATPFCLLNYIEDIWSASHLVRERERPPLLSKFQMLPLKGLKVEMPYIGQASQCNAYYPSKKISELTILSCGRCRLSERLAATKECPAPTAPWRCCSAHICPSTWHGPTGSCPWTGPSLPGQTSPVSAHRTQGGRLPSR